MLKSQVTLNIDNNQFTLEFNNFGLTNYVFLVFSTYCGLEIRLEEKCSKSYQ